MHRQVALHSIETLATLLQGVGPHRAPRASQSQMRFEGRAARAPESITLATV
jgi:hypothetical protein